MSIISNNIVLQNDGMNERGNIAFTSFARLTKALSLEVKRDGDNPPLHSPVGQSWTSLEAMMEVYDMHCEQRFYSPAACSAPNKFDQPWPNTTEAVINCNYPLKKSKVLDSIHASHKWT